MTDIEITDKNGNVIKVTRKHVVPATIDALARLARAIFPFGRKRSVASPAEDPLTEASFHTISSRNDSQVAIPSLDSEPQLLPHEASNDTKSNRTL